ncbi:MAG TPA: MGMT family protein [Anaeromyxobacter sp.]|nr:MGMT family protein [Anaeromyxobacter sp.]
MPLPAGWQAIYRIVRRIPRGRVATYGEIALLAGRPRGARQVGFALAALRGAKHDVPWQRVLGARPRGRAAISILDPMGAAVQRRLLEEEGVRFDARERVDLARSGWERIRRPPLRRASRPGGPATPSRSPPRTRGSSGRRRTSPSGRR